MQNIEVDGFEPPRGRIKIYCLTRLGDTSDNINKNTAGAGGCNSVG